MITLESDRLVFRLPEVHEEAAFSVEFQRTLRIPDDGSDYRLPPGLGRFPLRHIEDYAGSLSERHNRRGGVLFPMHQAEAMWLNFRSRRYQEEAYPFAVKIAAGKINAVSGEPWTPHLNTDPQDYVVVPKQPWLDGFNVAKGVIRQFVAMALGDGYSAEEQITGGAEHGGLQILAYPMKAERYEAIRRPRSAKFSGVACRSASFSESMDMGLAPGGRMKQEIFEDPYGLDAWDQRNFSRCFVTIANSAQWINLTGARPPTLPPTAAAYAKAGLPWFEYYDADAKAIEGAEKLGKIKSVKNMGDERGETPLPENESFQGDIPLMSRLLGPRKVREENADW